MSFFAVVAALAAQPNPTSRVELTASGDVNKTQYLADLLGNPTSHWGGAALTLTIYAQHPLVDDDTPYGLQPFLQRAGRVWIDAGGGSARSDQDGVGTVARDRYGGASAGFDLYVNRWIALNASFHVQGDHLERSDRDPSDALYLHGSLGVAVRWNDVRFDFGYSLDGDHSDGEWLPTSYTHFHLGAQVVVAQKLSLGVGVDTLNEGAGAYVAFTGFVTRKIGISFGLFGSKGKYVDSSASFFQLGGSLGLNGWISRHLGLGIGYSAQWSPGYGDGILSHTISFQVTSRVK